MERLIIAGLILTVIGVAAVAAGIVLSAASKADVKAGGVVFIGPIPIVFGSDRQTAYTAAALGLILMFAYYFFFIRR